jgi:radical SAM superfamily enzyme YgiQ (UPF0313 family)
MLPEEALTYFDTVVNGEAENIWGQLIQDFEAGQMKREYKGSFQAMLNSPKPRIELYNPRYSFGSIQATRGCPMKCDFCSVHIFNGSAYRPRPVKDVVDEFLLIPQTSVYFVDDNLIGYSKSSTKRIKEICKGIIKADVKKKWFCTTSMNVGQDEELLELMAAAGCKMIFLGIESELIDQLGAVNKTMNIKIGIDNYTKVYDALHKQGIAVLGAFIFGLESDTAESIRNRTDYILNSGIDAVQSTILTPLPGTPLFNRMQKEGRLLYTNFPEDWERYSFTEVVFKPKNMEAKELEEVIQESWKRLYSKKAISRKFMDTLKATRDPDTAKWALGANYQYHNLFLLETEKEGPMTDFMFN